VRIAFGDLRLMAIDMAKFLDYSLAMKTVNIGELNNNLSKFIGIVEKGAVVAIHKRNIPVASKTSALK
jgi:hypothetical protein